MNVELTKEEIKTLLFYLLGDMYLTIEKKEMISKFYIALDKYENN